MDRAENIPVCHLEMDPDADMVLLGEAKPSSRIFRSGKWKKTRAVLENIETDHNHSWYQELKMRMRQEPDALALFYRGTKVTFRDMFRRADELVDSFLKIGIVKDAVIPVFMSNTPEVVYVMLAANRIGAKLNFMGSEFAPEYIKELLNCCDHQILICTDALYERIRSAVEDQHFQMILLVSLSDSLPTEPEKADEYEAILKPYYHYENKVKEYQQGNRQILSYEEFVKIGKGQHKEISDEGTLDTEFLITYTSGSTKVGYPKKIVHRNRSLITMGRFHDPEVAGNPRIKGLRGLAHIHTESNTDLITCISDNLMQLWSVALEPEYGREKIIDYVYLNKPNYLNATTTMLVETAKQYLFNNRLSDRKFSFLLAVFAVGEKLTKGEERLINLFLKKTNAGTAIKINGLSLPYAPLSLGGGDCEHGGIYYTLWKKYYERIHFMTLLGKESGMKPVPYVRITALKPCDKGWLECEYNEYGVLVANSATTMVRYDGNPIETNKLLINDENGRTWVSMNTYGYIDTMGNVHVKGRVSSLDWLSDKTIIPEFRIEDIICDDARNVLSCTVIKEQTDRDEIFIANVELQPDCCKSKEYICRSIRNRCMRNLPERCCKNIFIRWYDNESPFPVTGAGKRNILKIEQVGLDRAVMLFNE